MYVLEISKKILISCLAQRKGEMVDMKEIAGKTRLVYRVAARSLVGFRVSENSYKNCRKS